MVEIRIASPADADALDVMVKELAAHERTLEKVRVDAVMWRRLLARPDVHVIVAESRGALVGYASVVRRLHLWSGRDLLALDDLYVRNEHRDQGVGSGLMARVALLAARDDLLVVWGVRPDNHSGQRFYARLGATINTTMAASWTPDRYRRHLA